MKMRGFSGCFGSWDCTCFPWKNYSTCLGNQYKEKESRNISIMEAICNPNMYAWYFDFGHPGLMNDINMFDRSSIVGCIFNKTFDTNINPYMVNERKQD